jgi:hypothetical protein
MVADYLTAAHQDSVYWRVTTSRPPSEGSHFAATFVALRGLRSYAGDKQRQAVAERLDGVRAWLVKTPAKDTEDRVFRLWALRSLDAGEGVIGSARDELLATQRSDGGWGQLQDSESDAYATGTALVVLGQAGRVGPTDPGYRRGVAYLLKTQARGGSWHVKSRSKPIQTYFETGFPHEADQFISSAATGWAATALAMTLPVHVDP